MDPPSSSLELLIGTQAFLPAVLSHIKDAGSHTPLPIDQVIFQSILLCLIAQDKHLIIRTPEEDVGLAVKLTVWTLSAVFNLSTQKVKLKQSRKYSRRPARASTPSSSTHRLNQPTSSEAFLRSIFLQPAANSDHASQDEASTPNDGHARSYSTQDHNGYTAPRHKQLKSKHSRRRSFPNSLSAAAHAQMHGNGDKGYFPDTPVQPIYPPESITSAISTTSTTTFTSTITSPSILKPQPIYAYSPTIQTPISTAASSRLPHANTDPLPLPNRRKKTSSHLRLVHSGDAFRPKKLPQALVVSGLEHSELSVQRALSNALGEGRFDLDGSRNTNQSSSDEEDHDEYGSWTLPEGFICVYICPLNSRDRPAVNKSLLDKFSMSTSLLIPQNVRNDFQLLHFPLSSSLPSPRTFHSSVSKSNPGSPSSPFHIPLPPTQTPPIYTKALPGYTQSHAHGHFNQHPHSPHHYHHRSATQFNMAPTPPIHTGTPMHPAHPLLSPNTHHTRPTTPIRLPPLLPSEFLAWLRSAYKRTRTAYTLDLYLADLMSAARHNSRLDGTLLTAKSMKDAMDLAKASRVVGTDLTGMELIRPTDVEKEEQKEEFEYEDFHSTPSTPGSVHDAPNSTEPKIFEASEVDIARVFPRVVSHRIKLRESPEDEILASALFGATFKPPVLPETDEEQGNIFDSVKSVLVSILSEV